ncbi:MAG TPA: His-Xaa-Ser system radical SAM maturase HxsC [Pelobium sp.]|nr:His-Xaa-Ser system radical SAM maturase HxsC [Pelobium sp.]
MLKTKGKAVNVGQSIVAKVTRDLHNRADNCVLVCEDYYPENLMGFKALVTNLDIPELAYSIPFVHQVQNLTHLQEGDVLAIHSSGLINSLYRTSSNQNFILVTERCNSNCLMCSQPPKDREDIFDLHQIHRQLIPLILKDCSGLGITGGEPTLMGNLFYEMLEQLQIELPDTEIHCLTNGRSFAWKNMADRLGALNYDKLMLGIPLYSDYYAEHDYIVQAKDAFNQTIQGLYNLASNNVRIEIRVVLQKQSIPRLTKLAKYIYKNLPFAEHITFMGLENQGYTPFNKEKLWIDPVNYMDELGEAVEFLSGKNMNVSIYNSQLCLMPQNLWRYSRKSISDWKNIYLPECTQCGLVEACGGLFASAEKMHSDFIKAL